MLARPKTLIFRSICDKNNATLCAREWASKRAVANAGSVPPAVPPRPTPQPTGAPSGAVTALIAEVLELGRAPRRIKRLMDESNRREDRSHNLWKSQDPIGNITSYGCLGNH